MVLDPDKLDTLPEPPEAAPAPADVPPVSGGRKRGRPRKDATATPAPPKADKAPKGPGRPSGSDVLGRKAAAAIATIGGMVALVEPEDGRTIMAGAERLGAALGKASETNETLRRMLQALGTGGAWTEVAIAAGAIVLPIAIHHNLVPALSFLAAPEPEPET